MLAVHAAIPPLGWVFIAIIVILFLITNIILIAFLVAKPSSLKSTRTIRGAGRSAMDLAKMEKVLRDPLADERAQLDELSDLVKKLPKKRD